MSDVPLEEPEGDDDLYVRGDDLSPFRPILTGDVFTDVPLSDHDEPQTVMLIGHPCTMRGRSGQLRSRLPAALVLPFGGLAYAKWPRGHYSHFPLLGGQGLAESMSAHLDDWAMVPREELMRSRRKVVLTQNRGILILQQRFVHSLTRVVVGLDTLLQEEAHVLEEASLEEDWLTDLCEESTLDEEIKRFAKFMDSGLRGDLLDPTKRAAVRKSVRGEIDRRLDDA